MDDGYEQYLEEIEQDRTAEQAYLESEHAKYLAQLEAEEEALREQWEKR